MDPEELLDADDGYQAWARELELEHMREVAEETLQAMRDNKCSREDYIQEQTDEQE